MTTVWHIFGTMDVGGAEMRTLELGEALARDGVRFDYVTLSGRQGVLDPKIQAAGGVIRPIPLRFRFPWDFYRALREHRPDAVDSHVATFSGLLVFIAWLARVPTRISHFRSDGDGHPGSIRRHLQRRAMRALVTKFSTDIIGVSPSALTLGYRSDWTKDPRCKVIPNGLPQYASAEVEDLRTTLGVRAGTSLVMHVGRPSPEKNRPLAVEVVSALRASGRDAALVLVGGHGVDQAAMQEVVGSHDAANWIHELGRRENVRDLMAQADVLILTSHREGLPGVVLEALSVGTPVVTSPLPGADYIAEHVEGVWVVSENMTSTWVTALEDGIGQGDSVRQPIREAFANGPFSLAQARVAHLSLYGGPRETS